MENSTDAIPPHKNNTPPEPLSSPIYVTSPFLPPIKDFTDGLGKIWQSKQLTNKGPTLRQFTNALSNYIDTDDVCLFNNGTLALQLGIQGLKLTGEVITTPFTFVATSHALIWNNIQPVFCDIEPIYYTLDPKKVEAAITPSTTAILAVHVFGHPCDFNALSKIAKKHNLKLIYDCAHAFGVKVNGEDIALNGDLSMFSFHATKLFHSLEGGMVVTADKALRTELNYLKNFGFKNETEVVMTGTNAKMNELQALMGLCVLKYIPSIIEKRKHLSEIYRNQLENVAGIHLTPPHTDSVEYNYAYFTIEVHEEKFGMNRDALFESLKSNNIYTRRYFYPLLCDLTCYENIPQSQSLNTAYSIASKILVLPLYSDLEPDTVSQICNVIISLSNTSK